MAKQRQWYRLHPITWIVVGLVVTAITHLQFNNAHPRPLYLDAIDGSHSILNIGWPFIGAELRVTASQSIDPNGSVVHGWHLLGNLVIMCLLVLSTAAVIDNRMRQARRYQLSLMGIFIFLTACCISAAIVVMDNRGLLYETLKVTHQYQRTAFSTFSLWAAVFALSCTLLTLLGISWHIVNRLRYGADGGRQRTL